MEMVSFNVPSIFYYGSHLGNYGRWHGEYLCGTILFWTGGSDRDIFKRLFSILALVATCVN